MSCNTLQDALSSELILHAQDIDTVRQLLMNGAQINYQSDEGWCLLFELISLNLHEEIASLHNHRLNLEIKDSKGRNALFWAIYHEHYEVLKTLIFMGCEIEKSVIDGLPALHYAVFKNNTDIVSLLLDEGIQVNCKDHYDNTALDYAYLYKNKEMVRVLTKRGAHTSNLDYE